MEPKKLSTFLSPAMVFQVITDLLDGCPPGWNISYDTDGGSVPEFSVTCDHGVDQIQSFGRTQGLSASCDLEIFAIAYEANRILG